MPQIFEPTPKQRSLQHLAASDARHILAFGGARSGKTFELCRCIAYRALGAPGSRHLICRLHHNDVRLSVMLDTWPKMMGLAFPGLTWDINKSDQVALLPDGAEVWFGGLDDKERVDKILGREFATIFINEASQVAYNTVLTLRTRLAQACTKRDGRPLPLKMYYDLNPVGMGHWTYLEAIKGIRPDARDVKIPAGLWAHMVMNPTDNPHLPAATLEEYAALPERQRKRFYMGEYQSEVPGALWPMERIDASRVDTPPEMQRIVVAVDPSGSDGTGGDMQGIVVAGIGVDGEAYILADLSCRLSPGGWANQVVDAYRKFGADRIVAERNFGGAMVESTIRAVDPNLPVVLVNASHGKSQRAEPVAALYEDRPEKPATVHHVGRFPDLEEQMGLFTTGGFQGVGSPDRVDALVWAISDLMLVPVSNLGLLDWYKAEAVKVAHPETVAAATATPIVTMIAPDGMLGTVYMIDGTAYMISDGRVQAKEEHVAELKRMRFKRVDV